MDEIEKRLLTHERELAETEARSKSNSHRLDKLEQLADEIHAQNETLAKMLAEMKHTSDAVTALDERVAIIEKRPGDLWGKLIAGIIGAVTSGLVMLVINAIF